MKDLNTSPHLIKNNNKPVLLDQYGHKYVAAKSTLAPKPTFATDNVGFFAARWNKDNLWNIVFWLGTSFCVTIADLLLRTVNNIFGFLLFFSIVIFSPYLMTRFNQVTYKDKMFFSSVTKKPLMPHLTKGICVLPVVSIIFTIFSILFIHDHHRYLDETFGLYNAIFWFIPTLYFIIKNCPISILFNKKALSTPVPGVEFGVCHGRASSSGINPSIIAGRKFAADLRDRSMSPSYRHLSYNVHHKR